MTTKKFLFGYYLPLFSWMAHDLNFIQDDQIFLKVALGVSPQFFSIWTRVLNHNKYVEIR